MSKNLQQIQVSGGVVTPDKLFTDNILETRLKAAEEAKMQDKRLTAAEREAALSRELQKEQYEATNALARDKFTADVEDQKSRLALLRDQDARQAALHGMQISEAGMKLDKLARADAAEKAYVAAISNPEELRSKALLESSPEGRKLLQEQQAVISNLSGLSEEDRTQAVKALPSVLNPDNLQGKQAALDAFRSNVSKEALKDNVRSQLASRLGTAPTEEQVNAIVGDMGVDYAAQQKALEERYDKESKQLADIAVAGIRSGNLASSLSSKPSGVASGLTLEGTSPGAVFSSKDNYMEAKHGAVIALTELKDSNGNPLVNPKDMDSLVELAAVKGITGYDSDGKAHFDMSPEELAATAIELKNSGALQRMQTSGKTFGVDDALTLMGKAASRLPNVKATYAERLSNALYGDSGANLPKTAPKAGDIGSTYDFYTEEQKAKNNAEGRKELNLLLQSIEQESEKLPGLNYVATSSTPVELLKLRASRGDEKALLQLDKDYRTGLILDLMHQQRLPISELAGGAVRLLRPGGDYTPQEASEASGFAEWKRKNDVINRRIEELKKGNPLLGSMP